MIVPVQVGVAGIATLNGAAIHKSRIAQCLVVPGEVCFAGNQAPRQILHLTIGGKPHHMIR